MFTDKIAQPVDLILEVVLEEMIVEAMILLYHVNMKSKMMILCVIYMGLQCNMQFYHSDDIVIVIDILLIRNTSLPVRSLAKIPLRRTDGEYCYYWQFFC